MERIVEFQDNELATADDFNNVGGFARSAMDRVVNSGIEPGLKFWGFPIVKSAPAQVTVGAGHITSGGAIYYRDDPGGVAVNLIDHLPAVTKRIVVITAWGTTADTDTQPRSFLIDPIARTMQARVVAVESRRVANIGTQQGSENSSPVVPSVDASSVAIAYVTLNTTGVESIVYVEQNRMQSVRNCADRLDENDRFRQRVGSRLDTLGTDISALAKGLEGTARQALVSQVAYDLAVVKNKLNIPALHVDYGADYFLTANVCDFHNPLWLARQEEGIRFPAAQESYGQLSLLNPLDPTVVKTNDFIIPAYVPVTRISCVGNDSQVSLSQFQYQTTQILQKTKQVSVVRYGSTYTYCTNSSFWSTGNYDAARNVFTDASGNTYQVSNADIAAYYKPGGTPGVYYIQGGTDPHYYTEPSVNGFVNHELIRLQQFWTDTTTENYTDSIVVQAGVNGSVCAQTFLNSQDGWLTGLNLFFSQVAGAGDVTVCMCETTDDGAPNPIAVIGRTTVPVASLKVWPAATPVALPMTFLTKGKRYAILLFTAGAHFACQTSGNKYAQGTFFNGTDGAYFQGDLLKDLAFEAIFAQFTGTRVETELTPLQLANGIANIGIRSQTVAPDGTTVTYYVQNSSTGVWIPLDGKIQPKASLTGGSGLNGLLPLMRLKVVFTGTTDVMPGIGVGTNSSTDCWRPRTDFTAIVTDPLIPSAANHIQIECRVESWDPAATHTCTISLLTGATYATPAPASSVTTEVPDDDPNARVIRATFDIPGITKFKTKIVGATASAVDTFHVAYWKFLAT